MNGDEGSIQEGKDEACSRGWEQKRKEATTSKTGKDGWGRSWKVSRVNTGGNGRMDLYGNLDKNQTWNNKEPSLAACKGSM